MAQLLWKTIWHVLKLKIELPLLRRFSHVRLCATPWTATYQAPPSMRFSRQEYWSGLPLPSPIYALEYNIYLSLSALLHSV